ncbi:hypothetical protein Lepto7375DRAFT_4677 [Leptolyngbya sp. PCC 7375]|nr:hypothetical protein Lepto7375DRAFT_4677 [Leptolyngbya sp. PCC 7375]
MEIFIYHWVNEGRGPNSETVIDIFRVLKKLSPEAARVFVKKYFFIPKPKKPSKSFHQTKRLVP